MEETREIRHRLGEVEMKSVQEAVMKLDIECDTLCTGERKKSNIW